jgi:hypothetical protein
VKLLIKLVKCSLVVKVGLHLTERCVVEEVNEALPCSGQLASSMPPVGPTQCETRWRVVLDYFDKQHETLIVRLDALLLNRTHEFC